MLFQALGYESIWIYTISLIVMVSMVVTLVSCLCCRRKQEIKNDLLGLEGMVKLTNPEEMLMNSGHSTAGHAAGNGAAGSSSIGCEVRSSTGFGSDIETSNKRTSNAPHRSLPDIPIAEPPGDNNSELYATVGDKVQDLPQGRSPTTSLKKQTSVSQHSSISQADDISSPYARVRSPPHAYDKLRRMEHPYAQVTQPGTSSGAAGLGSGTALGGQSGKTNRAKPRDGGADDDDEEDEDDDELMSPISRRESSQNLEDRDASTVDIPAASAIAGRVSASQDLPYMTPPIVQPPTQHFSGDSQDSSKGYTSISVREPLANLLPQNHPGAGAAKRRQILGDSHYATVSDDSDEMYAAIDDPNNAGDLYTSGSETYAQIQPPNAVTVSVEINTGASSRPQPHPLQASTMASDTLDAGPGGAVAVGSSAAMNRLSNHSTMTTASDEQQHHLPPPPAVSTTALEGGLRAQTFVQHSRQPSSSSCTSSVGNLGSPKPEKRQANSPLPPTPKTLKHQTNSFFSNSNQSVVLVSETESGLANGSISGGGGSSKPKKSPSKDLEGMYAKVMKKNKLSKVPSQNASPVPLRKDGSIDEQQHQQQLQQFLADSEALNGGVGSRMVGFGKVPTSVRHIDTKYDPGYDTIPGGDDGLKKPSSGMVGRLADSRKAADYAKIQKRNAAPNAQDADSEPGYESLPGGHQHDPGYETLNRSHRAESDSDPNYEILRPANVAGGQTLPNTVKSPPSDSTRDSDGYSSIREPIAGRVVVKGPPGGSARSRLEFSGANHPPADDDADSTGPGYSSIREDYDPGYSVISERKKPPPGHDYASITEDTKKRKLNINNNIEPADDESDIYSSIPHTASGTLTLPSPLLTSSSSVVVSPVSGAGSVGPTVDGSTNYCTIPERPGRDGTGVAAGGNLSSSPGYSSISETRTTPSSTDGDGSTSSPDQPIGYGKHNNTTSAATTNNSLSRISSNYESLTGSESDPNYESVKYLNVKENPYERLHNEAGGGVASDPLRKSVTADSLTTDSDTTTPTPSTVAMGSAADSHPIAPTSGTPTDGSDPAATTTPPVSDYFQV
ncbi:mucin-12 [Anopheles bellator]|uniref:mucin-12 n=1 Tax=Anopheles bellator TaxID=139047 RepID=UPI002647E193|nr:mucin-12 [Anopheles bellator]